MFEDPDFLQKSQTSLAKYLKIFFYDYDYTNSVAGLQSAHPSRLTADDDNTTTTSSPLMPTRRLRKKYYDRVHSGPIAILYRTVRIHWQGQLILQISGGDVVVTSMDNRTIFYNDTAHIVGASVKMIRVIGGEDSVRVILAAADGTVKLEPLHDRLERTVEFQAPRWNLTLAVTFTDAVWSNKPRHRLSDSRDDNLRPWIDFLSLPFGEDGDEPGSGILLTSGLLSGLRQLSSPSCWNLFCLTAAWCGPADYCCPHLLGRVSLLAANDGGHHNYPAEYTKNFVTFSRRFLCPAATPFSLGCPDPSWQRHNFLCYRLFSERKQVTLRQAVSACRGHTAKLVILAGHGAYTNNSSINNSTDELNFVLDLLRGAAPRRNGSYSAQPGEPSGFSVWIGGRHGRPEQCLRLEAAGSFMTAAGSSGDCVGGAHGYVCQTAGCEAGERHCCRLTWTEHLRWERQVLGKSFILRPAEKYDAADGTTTTLENSLTLNLAYGVIGGTIAFVVLYRLVMRNLEQRRYTARSLTRY
jgi:hypothetical protein